MILKNQERKEKCFRCGKKEQFTQNCRKKKQDLKLKTVQSQSAQGCGAEKAWWRWGLSSLGLTTGPPNPSFITYLVPFSPHTRASCHFCNSVLTHPPHKHVKTQCTLDVVWFSGEHSKVPKLLSQHVIVEPLPLNIFFL